MVDPAHRRLSVSTQCALLGLPRSTWYYRPVGMTDKEVSLMNLIDQEYTKHPFYGSRRMVAALGRAGVGVNRKRVERLMRLMGLWAIYPEPRLSLGRTPHRKYPYLLRGMPIEHPNQVWGTDITYLRLEAGFAYLVAFLDWYSRYVLSFEVSTTLDHQFCLDALDEALMIGRPDICNSDQGAQFTCDPYVQRLEQAKVRISMDGRGRALDNVFTERLWRTVKYEDVYIKAYRSPAEARTGLAEYFRFYNHERPHQSLSYRTPAEVYHACR
jgi:putative transposase